MGRRTTGDEREPLDPDEIARLLTRDGNGVTLFDRMKCMHCGGVHLRSCPRVKRIAFSSNGQPTEVEYWPHREWPDDDIVWPEELDEEAVNELNP